MQSAGDPEITMPITMSRIEPQPDEAADPGINLLIEEAARL